MPFLHFSTTKALTPPQKAALSAGIADCVCLLYTSDAADE